MLSLEEKIERFHIDTNVMPTSIINDMSFTELEDVCRLAATQGLTEEDIAKDIDLTLDCIDILNQRPDVHAIASGLAHQLHKNMPVAMVRQNYPEYQAEINVALEVFGSRIHQVAEEEIAALIEDAILDFSS